jgi:hypothetical protein
LQAIAEDACAQTGNGDATALDALAAVLARSGQFERASTVAGKAVQAAEAKNQKELVGEITARMREYQAGRAYVRRNR